MTGLGWIVASGLAAGVAYATRFIGPKVRSGDEVLITTAGVVGLAALFQMFPVLLMRVDSTSGGKMSGAIVGTGGALQADGTVVVARLGAPSPISNVDESLVVPNKFTTTA